jgi:nucleoside-diphosphate-sugar epimerase
MNVLVTGGAGFIGSHLVDGLLAKGARVRVLDNFSTGKRRNLQHVIGDIELLEGDVRDLDTCRAACAGIDRVWHLAALGSVPRSVEDPLTSHNVNITGSLHMLIAARDAGVRRLVFASSSSVYGANPQLPREETQHPMPISPYANNKLSAEIYTLMFAALYGMETVAMRYFNVYGPRQDPGSQYAAVVPLFFSSLLSGKSPTIFGDGEQSREFTFVEDCVQANMLAGTVDGTGIIGEAFNVAAGRPATVNRLLATIQQTIGIEIPANYLPSRAGDVRFSDAITTKIVSRLGFDPHFTLEAGIAKTADWYQAWHAAGCPA